MGSEGKTEIFSIEDAVKILLLGLGEDINREGLKKTPFRVAKAFREGTKGYEQNESDIVGGALFPEPGLESNAGGGGGGQVVVRDIDLFSYCESCLIPFHVKCHVGYVPAGERVVGLSKLARVAGVYAKRLQEPGRLAAQICSALHRSIKPAGVAVVLLCSHIHLQSFQPSDFEPKNRKGSIEVLATAGSEIFEDKKAEIWTDFLGLLRFSGGGAWLENDGGGESWCPTRHLLLQGPSIPFDPKMLGAVSSILSSVIEDGDPLRKELTETPACFLSWLMNFKRSNFDHPIAVITSADGGGGGGEGPILSELNIPFLSQCEHHLLPFHGVVHVGYRGGSSGVGSGRRSLLRAVVGFYGFKLQVQERLTRQIAEAAAAFLGGDVMVVAEAAHTCMVSRGIEKFGCTTSSVAVLGRFAAEPSARKMFLQMIAHASPPPESS